MSGTPLSNQLRWQQTYTVQALASVVNAAGQFALTTREPVPNAGVVAARAPFKVKQTELDVYERITEWTYTFTLLTNDVAVGTSFYLSMFPVTALLAGTNPGIVLGAEVNGSRSQTVTPTAGAELELVGPIFQVPIDGVYVLVLTTAAAWAANSAVGMYGHLGVFAR